MKRKMIMVLGLITIFTLGEFAWTQSAVAREGAIALGEPMPDASAPAQGKRRRGRRQPKSRRRGRRRGR